MIAAWAVLATAAAALAAAIAPFSAASPGEGLPSGWRPLTVPDVRAPDFSRVVDGGQVVLRVRSVNAAGAAMHPLRASPARTPTLAWRWKVDRVVEAADLRRREGDDFAARVYVFFDVPEEELPLAERLRIRVARWVHGAELPTAALCYVWDNRHPVGTAAWNPYTNRVRTVVVESGAGSAGRWVEVRRDLEADFRAAFGEGWTKPVPEVTGVAAGNDTDQSGEAATAWFGDFRLEQRR